MSRHRRALAITVRELRARRRFSQEELSFAAGRSRGYVGDLEAGRRATTFESVAAIAEALDVTMEELGRLVDARLAEQ
jgi:transcriptional regulator with XRE-family HTH domain